MLPIIFDRRRDLPLALIRLGGAAFRPVRFVLLLLGLFVLRAHARVAYSAGTESLRRADNLALTVDSRWAGGMHGGYYPIRIRVANSARPRDLVFRFVDTGRVESKLPTVERRVRVDQNSTQEFTLSIPLVSPAYTGELRVYAEGRLLEPFTQHVGLPDVQYGAVDRPALLVIHGAPTTVDCGRFQDAVQAVTTALHNSPAGMGGMGATVINAGSGAGSIDAQVIGPALLPESWIDYTTLDIIAVPLATFEKLRGTVRDALVQWTEAGGTLLVTDVGGPVAESKELARLLDLEKRPAESRIWHPAEPGSHRPIVSIVPSATRGMVAQENPNEIEALAKEANKPIWIVDSDSFRRVDLMAGRVYAFPSNPFPGATVDWAWWLNSANWSGTLRWTARMGLSGRERHPGFFDFLIPGVGGVPVIAFVLLISIFAIAIGPVNYLIALRRKQLYLLVVTIPATAFLTSLALFAYAMIADGFRTQSRLLSYTMLDQGTQRAVSFNRLSLFSGLAPSGGMRFSRETAVFPIWSNDVGFEGGTVDWTETQSLPSGWLRSRTRTQFETIAHRTETGRLNFKSTGDDTPPEVSNGFEWAIDRIVVRDEAGRIFSGTELPAGGSIRLAAVDPADTHHLTPVSLYAFPLSAPPGTETQPSPFSPRYRRGWFYGQGNLPPISFAQSTLQRGIERLSRTEQLVGTSLSPRSYFALLRDNPGIELGVERTLPKAGAHVLLGRY